MVGVDVGSFVTGDFEGLDEGDVDGGAVIGLSVG